MTKNIDHIKQRISLNDFNLMSQGSLSKKQEGVLLEYAFLLSSVIEKLTTLQENQGSLSQKDKKLFHEIISWMEELETADEYLAKGEPLYMLQPDWVELMETVRKTNELDLSQSIKNALEISRGIVDNQEIPVESQNQINDFVILSRKLLSGIMAKLSQGDETSHPLHF